MSAEQKAAAPLKVLVTIPHYYDTSTLKNASNARKMDASRRAAALAATISALHQTLGQRQGLIDGRTNGIHRVNRPINLGVAICTTGDKHLLPALEKSGKVKGLYYHESTTAEPALLGYACHAQLKKVLGVFDWYCYMEDDLALTDPQFFTKLAWFNTLAKDERAVLLPNRCEADIGELFHKLYIDGNHADATLGPRFQDISQRPSIEGEAYGQTVRFQRVDNAHAGSFFLTAAQMAHWAAQPDFLDNDGSFVDPIASAATLGLMRHFKVYKPARENADFLELRHTMNYYLGKRMRFGQKPDAQATPAAKPAGAKK